jgi:NAD(P)-dependent dehydrogenase (short-subunit alcohol dehydrogenase family)
MSSLAGKIAVVTGAGGGIGRCVAQTLAGAGARVVAADIRLAAAEQTVASVGGQGGEAITMKTDISLEADWQALVTATEATFGGIDILVNNAAAFLPRDLDLLNLDVETWDTSMRINARGPMLGCKHCIPAMLRRGSGAIVNITSGAALTGMLTQLAYSAAKATTISLTRSVATLHGKQGIRCNAIAPGLILHEQLAAMFPKEHVAIDADNLLTPASGTVADIANAVLFLASDQATFINGQVLSVDGGLLAHTPGYAQARALGAVNYLDGQSK